MPVGTASIRRRPAQRERATVNRNIAMNFGRDVGDCRPPPSLPFGEPARNAFETGPPECARLGIIVERGEMRSSKRDELAHGVGWQASGGKLGEIADGGMDQRAAFRGAGWMSTASSGFKRKMCLA